MKRKRHNPEQIIRKLRTAEQLLNQGKSVADVCRALEVSAPTYHCWQQLYGGMKVTEAKRLKELELENRSRALWHGSERQVRIRCGAGISPTYPPPSAGSGYEPIL